MRVVLPNIADPHPRSCRSCRAVSPNSYIASISHWTVLREGVCIAQSLTRNHVLYEVEKLAEGLRGANNKPSGVPPTGKAREAILSDLRRDVERAAELWGHMPDTGWLDPARALLARADAVPEHHAVAESEEVALW